MIFKEIDFGEHLMILKDHNFEANAWTQQEKKLFGHVLQLERRLISYQLCPDTLLNLLRHFQIYHSRVDSGHFTLKVFLKAIHTLHYDTKLPENMSVYQRTQKDANGSLDDLN